MDLVKRSCRKVGSITIIGMLFSSVNFMLESVNPDIAYASTFTPECLDRLKDLNFTSLEYYQCADEKCVSPYADASVLREMCNMLDPSNMNCLYGDIDFGIGCPTSTPQAS